MSVRTQRRNVDMMDASSKMMEDEVEAPMMMEVKEWEPTPFALKIMAIADEEDDYISNETLKNLEDMMRPDRICYSPRTYSGMVIMKTAPRAGGRGIEITQDQLDTVKTVTDVVKKMAEVGKFVFSKSEKILKYLGPIGTAAGVLKDVIEFFEEKKPDPVMKEFGELKSQLTALSNKMTTQFDDLKSFVVEHDFYGQYTVTMMTMNKYLIDTINGNSKEAVALFENYYKKKRPQELVYELISQLEIDAHNPLKWGMKGDGMQSKATFEKWTELLESVLSQAVFIETFAAGLLDKVSQHGQTMIIEKMAVYFELVKKWEQHYLTTPEYWPQGVQTLLDDVHENQRGWSDNDKASGIMRKLDGILTNDKFFVVCFGDHIWANHVTRPLQCLVSTRNDYNIIVYRSEWNDSVKSDHMKAYFWGNIARSSRFEGWQFNHWSILRGWARQLEDKRLKSIASDKPGFGMYLMVGQNSANVACKHSDIGSTYWKLGPGFYSFDGELKVHDGFTGGSFPVFWLFAQ